MAAHLYWRIKVTANNGDSYYLSISELEMRVTLGGADQCVGGTATASSSESGSSASRAVDDNPLTSWTTAFFSTTGWWQYQFPAPVDVVEYVISQSGISSGRSPRDWVLEYSDDALTWGVADTQSGQTGWASTESRTFSLLISPSTTPISGGANLSVAGVAAISLGTSLAGSWPASITGAANLDNGATLIAAGRIEATPRARLAGSAAPSANTGNFFLLF